MQSQVFPKARGKFLTGQLSWLSANMRAILLPESFTPDFNAEFVNEIAVGSRIATSNTISNRTAIYGVAGGDAIKFASLLDPRLVSQALIYRDTGLEVTSDLIFYIGADDLVNEPFIPSGFNYYIYPNAVDGGFFRL